MDVAVDHDRKRMLAPAVRQFAPSRIEKQLLTQVFELLCNPPSKVEHSESTSRETTRARSETQVSSELSACEKPFARRHVA
jgi:hypothetical protein